MAYTKKTKSIMVSVEPIYLEEQSEPEYNRYLWAYHVRIENQGKASVQLLNRYWVITDAYGIVKQVRGSGVVGKQPILAKGEVFEYTSGTPLTTSSGIMIGTYQMVNENGDKFNIDIPAFPLDIPDAPRSIN